jgi:hypothetical protein
VEPRKALRLFGDPPRGVQSSSVTGSAWRVDVALAAPFRDRHDELVELIPSFQEDVDPGLPLPGVPQIKTWTLSAMWIREPAE